MKSNFQISDKPNEIISNRLQKCEAAYASRTTDYYLLMETRVRLKTADYGSIYIHILRTQHTNSKLPCICIDNELDVTDNDFCIQAHILCT